MFIAKPMGVVQSMGQKLYTQPFCNGDIVLMLICCVVLSPNPSSSSLPSSFFLLLPSPCSSLLKGLLQTAQSSQNSRGKLLRRHCSPEKRERGRGVGEREGGRERKRERKRQHMDEDRKERDLLWKGLRAELEECGGICSSSLSSLSRLVFD